MLMPISQFKPIFYQEIKLLKLKISSEKDSLEKSMPKMESLSQEKKKKKIKFGFKEPVQKTLHKLVFYNKYRFFD